MLSRVGQHRNRTAATIATSAPAHDGGGCGGGCGGGGGECCSGERRAPGATGTDGAVLLEMQRQVVGARKGVVADMALERPVAGVLA